MTSGERRGIVALAVITLLVTLAGFLGRSCESGMRETPAPAEVTTMRPDSAENAEKKKERKRKKGSRRNHSHKTGRKRQSEDSRATPRDFLSDTIMSE